MRYALIGLACVAGFLQAGLPANASGHSAKTLRYASPAAFSKAQCVQQILAYRGAISYLDRRLNSSPEAVTYVSSTGEKITVENRFRKQVQYNQDVLNAGLSAKLDRCRSDRS